MFDSPLAGPAVELVSSCSVGNEVPSEFCFGSLGVLAGEIGIAAAGAQFDGMAAAENDVVDFAHLCGFCVLFFF